MVIYDQQGISRDNAVTIINVIIAMLYDYLVIFQGDSEEGFIYIMYLVGKSLGILDEYNLCSGTVQQTKQRCTLLLRQVILANRDIRF